MAGNITNYLEQKLLEHSLGRTAWTKPAAVYLALFTVTPTDSTTGTECGDASYDRQAVTWASASNGTIGNNITVTFGPMSGNTTIVAMGVFDTQQSGTGNLLWYGPLSSPRDMVLGDELEFIGASIQVSLD